MSSPEALDQAPLAEDAAAAAPHVACSQTAKEGDYVILWGSQAQVSGVVLKSGGITNNRWGSFHHDEIIGLPFGSKVTSRKGGAWLAMLRPTPEMITQSVVHRTQIIYHADISLLLMLLDARPGKVFVEAGTGSGSVSASLARALSPGGRLHTFEFHEDRQQQAQADFERYGLQDTICSRHRDVCTDGFGDELEASVDGVFLDLPMPWEAIKHVDRCLVEGGKVCTFSPCIEQIDKTATELRRGGRYRDIRMFETLASNWAVRSESQAPKRQKVAPKPAAAVGWIPSADSDKWLSWQLPMRSHTGYLMVARKALDDDLEQDAAGPQLEQDPEDVGQ